MAESCDPNSKVHALNIRPYRDLVEKFCSHGIDVRVAIPQVAVTGDQSSGKSSILEFYSRNPFPRGSGLVTKCASQLTKKKSDTWRSWAVNESIENSSSKVFQVADERERI
jgi:interferon-induced GTP-binding protein Mx1